jgi:hypothetical protein
MDGDLGFGNPLPTASRTFARHCGTLAAIGHCGGQHVGGAAFARCEKVTCVLRIRHPWSGISDAFKERYRTSGVLPAAARHGGLAMSRWRCSFAGRDSQGCRGGPIGGEGGIRTLGTRKGTTVFETAPIDRSGTSPDDLGARPLRRRSLNYPGTPAERKLRDNLAERCTSAPSGCAKAALGHATPRTPRHAGRVV